MLEDYSVCAEIFNKNGLVLPVDLYKKLDIYAEFLCDYNEKVNLTAITDAHDIFVKHFLDSIIILNYISIPEGASIIDVGTGAGFPSIPLKLYRPDLKITLLDSLNKRIIFLDELCKRLEINSQTVHSRAELLSRDKNYRDKFDFAFARAVAAMPVLCEYCMPFVKPDGFFIAMKGPTEDVISAKSAVFLLGGRFEADIPYELINGESRRIVSIKKISHTPSKYPRNSAQIKSKSL